MPAEFTKQELQQQLEKVRDVSQENFKGKGSVRMVNVGAGGIFCGTCHIGQI
jgi:hypothetical protein